MLLAARVVVAAVLLWALCAASVYVVDHGAKPVHADAVVVLSGSRTRLPVGLRLVREGYAPLLLVSQGGRGSRLEDETCAHQNTHVRCFQAVPYSTRGEAEAIGRFGTKLHLSRIDVVTSQFHVFRARILLRRCFHGDVHMVGAPQDWWRLPGFAVTETVKLVYQLTVARAC